MEKLFADIKNAVKENDRISEETDELTRKFFERVESEDMDEEVIIRFLENVLSYQLAENAVAASLRNFLKSLED